MEKFDPYSLISSDEMREHVRKTHLFSFTEMVALIVYSPMTMREKIALLEQFCIEFNFEEWKLKWLAQPGLTEAQDEWRRDYLSRHNLTGAEIAHIRDAGFPHSLTIWILGSGSNLNWNASLRWIGKRKYGV